MKERPATSDDECLSALARFMGPSWLRRIYWLIMDDKTSQPLFNRNVKWKRSRKYVYIGSARAGSG